MMNYALDDETKAAHAWWLGEIEPERLWAPRVVERIDLSDGVVFIMTCDAGFNRKLGTKVVLDSEIWEVLRWDDHCTANGPSNGENIALKVRKVPCVDF